MSSVKHAIISCAGLGSRLGVNRPKALVEIFGKTLIERIINLLENVEDIRIVTGFMETELMEHVKSVRRDIVFIRNRNYATTTNMHSLYLAAQHIRGPFLAIDGDLIINTKSFNSFLEVCKDSKESIIGITDAKTEEAVFVTLDEQKRIIDFSFDAKTSYEWCGIAYVTGIKINHQDGYVYRLFEPYLPLKSYYISCHEIDTPLDMEAAIRSFV